MKRLLLALLFTLQCTLGFAQAQSQEFRHFDNFGGLNTKDSSILMAENESPDCQNVVFSTKGAIIKRQGYDRLNLNPLPDADQITSLYQYNLDNGNTFFIGSSNTKIYKMESLDGTWDNITGSENITADKNFKWVTWNNTLVGTDDTDTPLKWTGTGNIAEASIPTGLTAARDLLEYRNYYMYFNCTVSGSVLPSRFYYSNLKDIDTWTATDFVDIAPSDGDEIVGAIVLGSDLYVFKQRSVYQVRLTGDAVSPFVVRKTNSHVGAVSTYGIILVNNTILFPSYDGFYAFNGDASVKISDKIDPTYASITKSALNKIAVAHYQEDNQIWWSVPDGSTNDTILVWDYSNKAWTKFSGINAAVLGTYYDSGEEKIYHGNYGGLVFEDDNGDSDDGTAIDGYWTSKWFDFGSAGINKRLTNVIMVTDDPSNDLDVGYSYNFAGNNERTLTIDMSSSGAQWDVSQWDIGSWAGQSFLVHRLNTIGQGRFLNIQFSNDDSAEDFTVYGYSLLVRPMGGF